MRLNKVVLLASPRSGAGLIKDVFLFDKSWNPNIALDIDEKAGFDLEEQEFTSHRWVETNDQIVEAIVDYFDFENKVIDWSPRNSLRAGVIGDVVSDSKFIFVVRRPIEAISSLMNAWRSGRFVSVADLPGWWGERWSFPLVEGWKDVVGSPLAQVCAVQWAGITNAILDDLEKLPKASWDLLFFEHFLDDPQSEMGRISASLGFQWQADLPDELPIASSAVTEPETGAWQKNASEIVSVLPSIQTTIERLNKFIAQVRPDFKWPEIEAEPKKVAKKSVMASAGTPFSSSQTSSLVELLKQSELSMVISTYKSGHVIVARAEDETLNTEFTNINRPMGIAVAGNRLAIGSEDAILTFTSNVAVAKSVDSPKLADLAYLPRSIIFTGDVAIHDMGYDKNGDLYFINTKFSCLSKQHLDYSFEPVWKPQWISNLAAEDRCHLNGLAMVNGEPRYVTALSQTDTPNGWREHKGSSGVIVDISSNKIIASNLSMPHSPRWYDNKLWVLESGKGSLASVDIDSGKVTTIATLPGFTRGLSFIGPYALVGLSQVRETVFTELPITQKTEERNCGVWVVDLRNGEIIGFLKFEGVVQEIFDVQVLPSKWPVLVDNGPVTQNAYVLSEQGLKLVNGTS